MTKDTQAQYRVFAMNDPRFEHRLSCVHVGYTQLEDIGDAVQFVLKEQRPDIAEEIANAGIQIEANFISDWMDEKAAISLMGDVFVLSGVLRDSTPDDQLPTELTMGITVEKLLGLQAAA